MKAALAPWLVVVLCLHTFAEDLTTEPLATSLDSDSECLSAEEGTCAVHALQRRIAAVRDSTKEDAAKDVAEGKVAGSRDADDSTNGHDEVHEVTSEDQTVQRRRRTPVARRRRAPVARRRRAKRRPPAARRRRTPVARRRRSKPAAKKPAPKKSTNPWEDYLNGWGGAGATGGMGDWEKYFNGGGKSGGQSPWGSWGAGGMGDWEKYFDGGTSGSKGGKSSSSQSPWGGWGGGTSGGLGDWEKYFNGGQKTGSSSGSSGKTQSAWGAASAGGGGQNSWENVDWSDPSVWEKMFR